VALNREVSSSIQAGNYAAAIPLAQRALRGRRAQIAAGADPEGEIGEDHNPETHLIPLVFDAALGRREAISVYGTDYPTPDGTAIRDYIHVMDLADAHVRALAHLLRGGESTSLNLGTGQGISVAQLIESARRVTGLEIPVRKAPRRSGDPAQLVADPIRARDVLGWTARRSELQTMLVGAWGWHKSRHPR
jgi:UDP-glucose 4-epimerase